ncbi:MULTISPECIES: hypothetical protein [unclassified Caballeronia]|uniref:hypothetical protein n=1 Tax=unclassified Caballeronia TaxID=2646786 RepID=UPI002027AB24|nr:MULTISPECIES: hypothetical protein [unclassified Caballeronia]
MNKNISSISAGRVDYANSIMQSAIPPLESVLPPRGRFLDEKISSLSKLSFQKERAEIRGAHLIEKAGETIRIIQM